MHASSNAFDYGRWHILFFFCQLARAKAVNEILRRKPKSHILLLSEQFLYVECSNQQCAP